MPRPRVSRLGRLLKPTPKLFQPPNTTDAPKRLGQDKVMDLVIVYFDLSEEIFKEICIPHWLVPSSKYEFGVFEESYVLFITPNRLMKYG